MTSCTGLCDLPPSLWPLAAHLSTAFCLPWACWRAAGPLTHPACNWSCGGVAEFWWPDRTGISDCQCPVFLHTGTQLTMADSPHKGQVPQGRGPSMLSGLRISPLKRPTLPADISHKWGLQPLPGTVCCPGNVGRNLGPRASQSCEACPFPSCEPASPST